MVDPNPMSRRERQIMDIVYAEGSATVRTIQEKLEDPPTVMAVRRMLHILEEKGHLNRKKEGATGERQRINHPFARLRLSGADKEEVSNLSLEAENPEGGAPPDTSAENPEEDQAKDSEEKSKPTPKNPFKSIGAALNQSKIISDGDSKPKNNPFKGLGAAFSTSSKVDTTGVGGEGEEADTKPKVNPFKGLGAAFTGDQVHSLIS